MGRRQMDKTVKENNVSSVSQSVSKSRQDGILLTVDNAPFYVGFFVFVIVGVVFIKNSPAMAGKLFEIFFQENVVGVVGNEQVSPVKEIARDAVRSSEYFMSLSRKVDENAEQIDRNKEKIDTNEEQITGFKNGQERFIDRMDGILKAQSEQMDEMKSMNKLMYEIKGAMKAKGLIDD